MASPPPSPHTETTSGNISTDVHVPNTSEPNKPLLSINLGNVIKLSPTNYISWKLQIQSILTGYGLEGFLDGSHPCPPATITSNGVINPNPAHVSWIRQDKLLFGALIGTLTPSVVSLITRANTTKDAWDTLSSVYAQPSRGHIKQLRSQLKKYTKGSKTITEYMHFIKTAADELALLGKPLDHEDFIETILDGLDESYKSVIDAVDGRIHLFQNSTNYMCSAWWSHRSSYSDILDLYEWLIICLHTCLKNLSRSRRVKL
ncbi:unnamed protein product [Cuscuta epithymum]|uniref:Retrotransposon Copia-like N-terminal domain-containing protein n=2 Tax=Cuscuta epithymum TaxID=186058 RepID=A0AAV0CV67_9ASTE|nr:unnamed protein product [Cuscuta epithymum]